MTTMTLPESSTTAHDGYGHAPTVIAETPLPAWTEFMHWMYLPVKMSGTPDIRIPRNLDFLRDTIRDAAHDAHTIAPHLHDPYIYVTARRGYATTDNPINRPGWHTDDFGGDDLNYIWTDQYPTRFLLSAEPLPIVNNDRAATRQMDNYVRSMGRNGGRYIDGWEQDTHLGLRVVTYPQNSVLRLDPYVIHTTPEIPPPGGMRSFFKISISTHRYNLIGNSHNYEFDYDWPMIDRATLRNDPYRRSNADHGDN